MQLALSMWSLVHQARAGELNVLQFLDYAHAQGVQGVELLDYFWREERVELPAARARAQELNLAISAYAIGNNCVQTDRSARLEVVNALRHGVDNALALGTSRVRVFSGEKRAGVGIIESMDYIVEVLGAGASYAAERGVTLVLENHGLFAGRGDQVKTVIERVGSPALRANFDTGNFLLVGQSPSDAVRQLAPLVAYVHLKDFRPIERGFEGESYAALDGSRFTGAVVGQGQVDLRDVLTVLRDAGYDGWLTLEFEGPEHAPTIGVPQSLAAAREILATLS